MSNPSSLLWMLKSHNFHVVGELQLDSIPEQLLLISLLLLEEVYRPVYYNAVDSIIAGIKDRFDQPGLRQYQHLEQLLLKGASGSDFTAEKDAVAELWGDELNMDLLESQLHILAAHFS